MLLGMSFLKSIERRRGKSFIEKRGETHLPELEKKPF